MPEAFFVLMRGRMMFMLQPAPTNRIACKTFVGPTLYRNFKSVVKNRDGIRAKAIDFINNKIGAENVISVTEHAMSFGPFTVAIYYRVVGDAT